MPNPYTPSATHGSQEPDSQLIRRERTFRFLAVGFLVYAVLGHALYYWRVFRAFHDIGPGAVGAYYPGAVWITSLSLVGAVSIGATYLYSLQKVRSKLGFVTLLLALVGSAAAVVQYYGDLGQAWGLLVRLSFS